MPSRTSSSKYGISAALLRSDLIRFSPLWAAYLAVWVLLLPAVQFITLFRQGWSLDMETRRQEAVRGVLNAASGEMFATILLAGAGCVFAMALFSYLTTSRSVGFAHALPLRRETLFLTHYCAGVAVFLTVHIAAALLTLAVWAAAGVTQLWAIGAWFLSVTGQMLFFFSFAVFCAMFAGQVLAIPAFYLIYNCLAVVLTWICDAMGSLFFYGWNGLRYPAAVKWLTPVWSLIDHVYVLTQWEGEDEWMHETGYTLEGLWAVGIYALAGLVLAALALLVYRRRASETAGDIVAVPWAKPLFRYGMGICGGMIIGIALYAVLWEQFFDDASAAAMAVSAAAGGVVCYFAAEMLLRKSFRVLKKSWRGAAVLCAALVLVCAAFGADLFGVQTRVPEPETVLEVDFSINGDAEYVNGLVEDPALIEKLVAVHQTLVDQRPESHWSDDELDESSVNFSLTYSLKNGGMLRRSYYFVYQTADLDDAATPAAQLAALFREPEIQMADLRTTLERIDRVTGGEFITFSDASGRYSSEISLSAEQAQTLLDAFLRDVEAGHAGKYAMDYRAAHENTYANDLGIYYKRANDENSTYMGPRFSSTYLSFTKEYTFLLAELEKLGLDKALYTRAELENDDDSHYAEGGWPEMTTEEASIGIIGGADGPTTVFVSGGSYVYTTEEAAG